MEKEIENSPNTVQPSETNKPLYDEYMERDLKVQMDRLREQSERLKMQRERLRRLSALLQDNVSNVSITTGR